MSFRLPNAEMEKLRVNHNVEGLIEKLKSPNQVFREFAVRYLGEFRDPRAVEPLLNTLATDSSRDVRFWAVLALEKISDIRSIDGLSYASVNDLDEQVREFAAGALTKISNKAKNHSDKTKINKDLISVPNVAEFVKEYEKKNKERTIIDNTLERPAKISKDRKIGACLLALVSFIGALSLPQTQAILKEQGVFRFAFFSIFLFMLVIFGPITLKKLRAFNFKQPLLHILRLLFSSIYIHILILTTCFGLVGILGIPGILGLIELPASLQTSGAFTVIFVTNNLADFIYHMIFSVIFFDIGIIFLLFFEPHSLRVGNVTYMINPGLPGTISLIAFCFGIIIFVSNICSVFGIMFF